MAYIHGYTLALIISPMIIIFSLLFVLGLPLYTVLSILIGFSGSGCVSIKPIYNSDEQALAEKGVSKLHRLYNDQEFAGIYELFDLEGTADDESG